MARKSKARDARETDTDLPLMPEATPAPQSKPAPERAGLFYIRREYHADGTLKG